jgi:polyisoprenoid-binding protein YceI
MRILPGALLFLALASAAAAPPVGAEALIFTLDPEDTQVSFTLAATLHTVKGRVSAVQGEIRVDTVSGRAEGEIILDARTAETGNRQRDAKMYRDVLMTEKHPEIVLRPVEIQGKLAKMGPSQVEVLGEILIAGRKHPLRFSARLDRRGTRVEGRASFVVPYVAWGLSDPSTFLLRVAKEVEVTINFVGQVSASA